MATSYTWDDDERNVHDRLPPCEISEEDARHMAAFFSEPMPNPYKDILDDLNATAYGRAWRELEYVDAHYEDAYSTCHWDDDFRSTGSVSSAYPSDVESDGDGDCNGEGDGDDASLGDQGDYLFVNRFGYI